MTFKEKKIELGKIIYNILFDVDQNELTPVGGTDKILELIDQARAEERREILEFIKEVEFAGANAIKLSDLKDYLTKK